MGGALRGASIGLAVCFLATACGGGEEPEPERVTAAEQCDGTLSPVAARALTRVLGTQNFDDAPTGGLERVGGELTADHAATEGRTPRRSLCRASPAVNSDAITVAFRLFRDVDLPGDQRAADMHPYDMGVAALSGPRRADLYVRCVSPRFQGSDKRPARIKGQLDFLKSELPDTVPVREANLTVLHSVTLAMARELGCEDDAGLDEEPVFEALPE
ncbi:hypothetical protein ACFWFX_03520 [Streptomyces roseolus]|uniref:hypothetical protein n=1 Tax=Streptomyces roseolus TaxID=67358 RepID=UPI003659A06C